MIARERRCYVCLSPKCSPRLRVFLLPGEPDKPPPTCPEHGPMARDENRPYRK